MKEYPPASGVPRRLPERAGAWRYVRAWREKPCLSRRTFVWSHLTQIERFANSVTPRALRCETQNLSLLVTIRMRSSEFVAAPHSFRAGDPESWPIGTSGFRLALGKIRGDTSRKGLRGVRR